MIANVTVPPLEIQDLPSERVAVLLFGNTFRSVLGRLSSILPVAAMAYAASGLWLGRASFAVVVISGMLIGCYCFMLLPPIDLFGVATDFLYGASIAGWVRVVFLLCGFAFMLGVVPMIAWIVTVFDRRFLTQTSK